MNRRCARIPHRRLSLGDVAPSVIAHLCGVLIRGGGARLASIALLGGLPLLVPVSVTATPIPGVETGTAGFVGLAESGPLDEPVLVGSFTEFETVFGTSTAGLSNPYLAPSAAGFFANGGQRLVVVRVAGGDDASLVGVDGGPEGTRTGLQALRDVDEVTVVAIPGATSPAVQTAMIALCEQEGDRMAVLDPASTTNVDAVLAQRAGLDSSQGHAALYFPWIQAAPTGVSLLLPPSGFVAGVYARTSPPDSPVGSVLTASDVSVGLTTTQQDALTLAGVDAIRFFAGSGVQVWGARTISSDNEWKYVPVRRVALYLEESIYEGTEWAVFEPNDEPLWASLRTCVGDFLQELFAAGWFQGTTPEDAYFVRVDRTTMTQQDIDEGRTIIQVGFAPLRPAEFVILQIVQQRTSTTDVPARSRGSFRLLPARPNPFNPRTTIQFEIPAREAVALRIYDVAGRLVRRLCDGESMDAGEHQEIWSGLDDLGRAVASGVYVCRLEAGGLVRTQRLTLVR